MAPGRPEREGWVSVPADHDKMARKPNRAEGDKLRPGAVDSDPFARIWGETDEDLTRVGLTRVPAPGGIAEDCGPCGQAMGLSTKGAGIRNHRDWEIAVD
jgi:hypothetical protein